MATQPASRPIAPHLMQVRWGPHMIVSILHRATGDGMATIGATLMVWWLAALAGGEKSYATFLAAFTHFAGGALGYLFGIGLTWALFQHIASGLRHFVMDTGAGYELRTNKRWAAATMIGAAAGTILFWTYLLVLK